jgi:excisionase family DNA binding protein
MTQISTSPPAAPFPVGPGAAAAEKQAAAGALTVPAAATRSTRAKDDPPAGPFLKVREMAALARVADMTIYRLIHAGELDAIRVGHSFRIPESAARSYLAGGRPDSGDAADQGTGTLPRESACNA